MDDEIHQLRRSSSVRDILKKLRESNGKEIQVIEKPKTSEPTRTARTHTQPVPKPRRRKIQNSGQKQDAELRSQVNSLNAELFNTKKELRKISLKNERLSDTVSRFDALLAEIQSSIVSDIKEKQAILQSISAACDTFELSL